MGIADATNDFISNDDVQTSMANLKRATDKLSAQSSVFASNLTVIQNRSTFTKSMIDTLKEGSDALTMADQNEESTNLLTLNTRQQLAQTTLSLAAQSDAAVTRLF
jgi:flagellin-like hook-associated protein FlgL